jgi:2-keto-4-pentenoate hydratase/2-oxohepta-3-ene-1,7-dioic acid hydratase in catechol pathway
MHLASIEYQSRRCIAVRIDGESLVDAEELLLLASTDTRDPSRLQSMKQLIRGGPELLGALEAAFARVNELDVTRIHFGDVRWLPPVVEPGKICAVAMNNSASNERKISAPDHPAFFLKPPSCLIGHGDAIRIRPYYGSVHPEPELALVIGQETRDVPANRALAHVFGYTIFDDVTGNGMRAEDRFHYWAVYARPDNPNEVERVEQHLSYAARYKGTDTFGVLGPWLVTADAVPNPDDLAVHCKVNGETVAEDNTRYYNYSVAEVVSFLSYFLTLHPGDVISLGTAFKPSPERKRTIHHANLQTVPGPVQIAIEGLGVQESPVVVEPLALGPWRLR